MLLTTVYVQINKILDRTLNIFLVRKVYLLRARWNYVKNVFDGKSYRALGIFWSNFKIGLFKIFVSVFYMDSIKYKFVKESIK